MRALLARATGLAGAFAAGAAVAHLTSIPHLLRLTSDLQRSRERILATREEERRRLRNDLHDDLGPTLASLAMSLDAARLTLGGEPERIEPVLTELRDRLATAVGEIRELAHGLRPPALDDLGLVAAVESLAEGAADRVDVRFDGDPEGLPAAVEVAAYWIVSEAVANVRKHARAATALVLVSRDADLHLMIADSGVGLPEQARGAGPGGLAAMRELAAEVGGTCTITSRTGGGTIVAARLPLAVPAYHRPPNGKGGRGHER
ncbi:sensor histidine kinase [Actinomadura parmotrematis]|uniref:Oxygen sensor histidine kinase NreB n=1 Tax=Actinomadura parmotrematis TaxID=2864039 RepID=A0ABS7FUK8_9ACTN|nr:histidine kinase [Actinomadura parmotrematis]MBW8484083.1 two-component sensor histidine kinase [Actinomadura parmotrematis]